MCVCVWVSRAASPPNVPTGTLIEPPHTYHAGLSSYLSMSICVGPVVRREHASTSTSDDDIRGSIKLKVQPTTPQPFPSLPPSPSL